MDLGSRGSGYHAVDLQDAYEGRDYQVELAELPKSRAPSYVSTSKQSLYQEDDDKAGLIQHARSASGFDLQNGDKAPYHIVHGISQTSSIRDKRRRLQGWHFGVRLSAWTATFTLVLNLLMTIIAAVKFGSNDGVGTAFEGSCDKANEITTWLHIVINGLSSILLSASNYTMQALAAPTRAEVDRAHSRGDWMDIGVASVRNLFKIRWHRVALWWMLAISSIPIHLLYNSAVFKSIDSNMYIPVVASPAWLEGGNFSTHVPWSGGKGANISLATFGNDLSELLSVQDFFRDNRNNPSQVQNLSVPDCLSTYGANFVSGNGHVVAVTNGPGNSTNNETMFFAYYTGGGTSTGDATYNWLCASNYTTWNPYNFNCDVQTTKKESEWILNGKQIDYCLSQVLPQHCTVQFSVQILVVVILMNAMKSIAMFTTLYKQKDTTLVTVGDAIASYLEKPDELTAGRCLMDRKDISSWKLQGTKRMPNTRPLPKTYLPGKERKWFAAASKTRWATCFGLIGIAIITSGCLLNRGMAHLKYYEVSPWGIGWGAIDARTMIDAGLPSGGGAGLVTSVLLANCPQAIVSFLYLLYNSLMTSLLLAKEWSNYALRPKALRVTTSHGSQRSTYYLQLPFRYSGPLLAISTTLHWVISQSIFLARIDTYDNGQINSSGNFSAVGYSCPPILVAMLIGITLSLVAIGMGFRKLKSSMPVASSCSVAIAAACHRPKDDIDAAYLPVQWGEVQGDAVDETGHCCFTTQPVSDLIPGRMYAGDNDFDVPRGGVRPGWVYE